MLKGTDLQRAKCRVVDASAGGRARDSKGACATVGTLSRARAQQEASGHMQRLQKRSLRSDEDGFLSHLQCHQESLKAVADLYGAIGSPSMGAGDETTCRVMP